MINEDKLILSSLQNWDFLKDNTGNLMSTNNIVDFLQRTQGTPLVYHFVTADGSIDCQLNPGEQEATVAHLQFTEIVTALHSLIPGEWLSFWVSCTQSALVASNRFCKSCKLYFIYKIMYNV